MQKPNPFTKNPFSQVDAVTLLKMPEAPETHEVRKPMRQYLGAGGVDMPNPPKKPRVIEKIKVVEIPT